MKTVYFIRHAKSSWANASLRDFDRPLNDRGLSDAPMMAERLHDLNVVVDGIVCSPSKRTRMTADFFIKKLAVEPRHIIYDDNLYHPHSEYLGECLLGLASNWDSVLVFTHNPAITMYVAQHATQYLDNMPTCGVAKINYATDRWEEVLSSSAKAEFIIYPKMFTDA